MRVLCISDGRPGHYNQTKGMIKAIEHLGCIDVDWKDVRLKWRFLRPFLKFMFRYFDSAFWPIVKKAYGIREALSRPDVVISAGGDTLYLNVSLAKLFGVKNFFIGHMRGLPSKHVFLNILLSESSSNNSLGVLFAPSMIDIIPMPDQKSRMTWMLAIGGDSGVYRYEKEDWDRLVDFLVTTQQERNIKWLITTSRRTANWESYIRNKVTELGLEAEVVWYVSDPKPVMQEFLSRSSKVFCTEDSFSMMTEIVGSGRPLMVLRPKFVAEHKFYEWALKRIKDRNLLVSIKIKDLPGSVGDIEALMQDIVPLRMSISEELSIVIKPYINEAL